MKLNYTDKEIAGTVKADPSFFLRATRDAKIVYATQDNIIKAYEEIGVKVETKIPASNTKKKG